MLTRTRASITAAAVLAVALPASASARPAPFVTVTPAKRTVAAVVSTPVTTTVTVRNRTARPLRHVGVRLLPGSGVRSVFTPRGVRTLVIARLPARSTRALRLRITPTRVGGGVLTVRATVGRRTVATRIAVVGRAAPPPTPTPTPTPTPVASRMAGRVFFHPLPLGSTKDLEVLAFDANGLAYHEVGGFTTPGLPVCAAPTDDGVGNGCRPYTDDGTSVTLAGQPVTFTASGIQIGAVRYDEAMPLAADTRLDTRLEYIHQVGFCPGPLCAFINSDLLLVGDGRFIMTTSAMGIGTDPNLVDWSAVGADQKGIYRIDVTGRVTLAFESGTVQDRVVAALRNDAGVFDPASGLLLGAKPYFRL